MNEWNERMKQPYSGIFSTVMLFMQLELEAEMSKLAWLWSFPRSSICVPFSDQMNSFGRLRLFYSLYNTLTQNYSTLQEELTSPSVFFFFPCLKNIQNVSRRISWRIYNAFAIMPKVFTFLKVISSYSANYCCEILLTIVQLCSFKVHLKNFKVFCTNPLLSIKLPNLCINKMSNRVKRQKETNFCNFD